MNSKSSYSKPELLSPAGSPAALTAALRGGADAVYLGGTLFNARMNAHNFDDDALRAAVDACHKSGARLYVTLNTLLYDRELDRALRYAAFLYEIGADALIVADLGLAALLRRYLPDLPLHASTQVSGHNAAAAQTLARQGFSRMVCARELSRENIKALTAASPIGIEMFVHGAMCVCHSGQCLFSAMVGGRSGNRGLCAQPCRMKYQNRYPLSLKDMCLAAHITDILQSGVESLKIEGRMKSPDYVYGVTRVWRMLLDDERCADAKEMQYLSALFSRSGFSDGYYTHNISQSMLGIRSEEDKAASRRLPTLPGLKAPLPHRESLPARIPQPIDIPDEATMRKLLLPRQKTQRTQKPVTPQHTARFFRASQIPDGSFFDIRYLPLDAFAGGKANGVILPPVIMEDETDTVRTKLARAIDSGATHILLTNLSQQALFAPLFAQTGVTLHGDFRLNVCNRQALALCDNLASVLVSPELSAPQIRDLDGRKGLIVYGRIPLMLLEKRVGEEKLRDRTGAIFPILHGDRDEIVNSIPTYLCDKPALLRTCGAVEHHWLFTVESRQEILAVIRASEGGKPLPGAVRRIQA